ncbi:Gfo/Idh/MocA family protein [Rubrobacter tropicus]|uniref:Gfo/Idh/MocA family protein n=1 Tax=Rubrobacter tropicus TaxID=2653851 RepID=UPI001A9FE595|nr:Gfo/Idh/MocA family oxidoreductase [Rubrobacter tropicus]
MQNSDTKPLRVGVVGLGYAGGQHLKNFVKMPNVEAVALAGLEEERLKELGGQYGVPNLYTNWEDLVAREDLNAIGIGAPNHLHAPIAIAALKSGKHVLCEKPLARTGAEAEGIVRAAREADRAVHIAFTQRERGDVQALKRHVEEGNLGRIYHAKATWMRRNGIPGMGGWFTSKEMAGGGPLIDLGVHMVDMALFLMGDPEVETVSCATYAELGPRGRGGRADFGLMQGEDPYEVEDLATAFIRLSGGATLNLEAGWAAYRESSDDFGVTLYGTEGGAEMKVKNYGTADTVRIFTDVAGVPAVVTPEIQPREGHFAVVRRFVETIRAGAWEGQNGDDGLDRARIIDACYASALENREVSLREVAEEEAV